MGTRSMEVGKGLEAEVKLRPETEERGRSF